MRVLLTSLVLFLVVCLPVRANDTALNISPNMRHFAQIPILHDGRIKPLDSFARAVLKTLSGRDRLGDQTAIEWLAGALFDPTKTADRPVIKITNPDVLALLDLEKVPSKLYAFTDVAPRLADKQEMVGRILSTPETDWTPAQKTVLALYDRVHMVDDVLDSLSLYLPIALEKPDAPPDVLSDLDMDRVTYVDLFHIEPALTMGVQGIIASKGEDIGSYDASERLLVFLSFVQAQFFQKNQNNNFLKVVPRDTGEWTSPWIAMAQDNKTSENWHTMARAWHDGDLEGWESAAQETYAALKENQTVRPRALRMEYLVNKARPFKVSFLFYGLSLVCLTIVMLYKRRLFIPSAAAFLMVGLTIHLGGIIFRIYILERPPVSTLYESILFVGLIVVAYGLWAWIRHMRISDLFIGAASGVILHQVGFAHAGEGDSMIMLSAVLNTNFWLATHVICITVAYAFCLITSLTAQFALLKWGMEGVYPKETVKTLHTVSILALLFAVVGTVLGGIWADQSWGRFWGWDPKENGALLIVLWLIWVLHGKVSNQFSKLWYLAGLAYVSVIVALSWFGVNLLSVGLHAYGFTDSAAWSLGGFTVLQTVALVFFVRRVYGVQKSVGGKM